MAKSLREFMPTLHKADREVGIEPISFRKYSKMKIGSLSRLLCREFQENVLEAHAQGGQLIKNPIVLDHGPEQGFTDLGGTVGRQFKPGRSPHFLAQSPDRGN